MNALVNGLLYIVNKESNKNYPDKSGHASLVCGSLSHYNRTNGVYCFLVSRSIYIL